MDALGAQAGVQAFLLVVLSIQDTLAPCGTGAVCLSDVGQLKSALGRGAKVGRAMFLATWSISETPERLRETILPLVDGFDAFLIAYQHRFGEVDNVDYFARWRERFGRDTAWQTWEIAHLPGNSYLVGEKTPAGVA